MFKQAYSRLLSQLEEMPAFLQRSAVALPSELLQRVPEKDNMPLVEHVWHVRDCDSDLYALRIRRVLQEDKPFLDPVDVGVWPESRNYRSRDGDLAISEFAELRLAWFESFAKSVKKPWHAREFEQMEVKSMFLVS